MIKILSHHAAAVIAVGLIAVLAGVAELPFAAPLAGCALMAVGAAAWLARRSNGSPLLLAAQSLVYSALWLLMAAALLAKPEPAAGWMLADLLTGVAVLPLQLPLIRTAVTRHA